MVSDFCLHPLENKTESILEWVEDLIDSILRQWNMSILRESLSPCMVKRVLAKPLGRSNLEDKMV